MDTDVILTYNGNRIKLQILTYYHTISGYKPSQHVNKITHVNRKIGDTIPQLFIHTNTILEHCKPRLVIFPSYCTSL